jgi:hypothetical protein
MEVDVCWRSSFRHDRLHRRLSSFCWRKRIGDSDRHRRYCRDGLHSAAKRWDEHLRTRSEHRLHSDGGEYSDGERRCCRGANASSKDLRCQGDTVKKLKWLCIAALLLATGGSTFAQGALYRIGPFNQPGLAYICPVPDGGTPCPSPVSIFTNVGLTNALSNPISIPQGATVSFWVTPGQYTIQFPASGYNQIVQIGGGGGGGSGTVTHTVGALTSGQIITGNGAADIKTGDLSGDATTAGSTAVSVVKVNGAALPTSKTIVGTNSSGQVIDASASTLANNTTGNAATATALQNTPSLCSAGQAPTGILASGNATGCAATLTNPMTTLGDEIVGGSSGTPTRLAGATAPNGVPQFYTSTPSAGAATQQAWKFSGVPVDGTSPATLLVTHRGNFIPFTGTTNTLTLPAGSGTGFGNNFFFSSFNGGSGNLTETATSPDTIDGGAAGGSVTTLPNFVRTFYQNNTPAWQTVYFPTFAAYPACADSGGNHLNFTTAAGFSCGTTSSGGTAATYFAYPGGTYTGSTITANGNQQTVWGIVNSAPASVGHITFNVTTADGVNNSAACIYNSSGTLIAHTAPATYGTTGLKTVALVEGTVTFPAGRLFLGLTSAASTLAIMRFDSAPTVSSAANAGTTSSGACLSSITPTTDAPNISGGQGPAYVFIP